MRKLAALASLCLVAAPLLAGAETATKTQILQQRTPDGGILLTDRPRPGAKTERSWQVEVEDPAAARRRALDVKAEANLVSERIERRIAQQRLADQEEERLRLARMDSERERAAQDDVTGGVILYGSNRLRAGARLHRHDGARIGRPHAGMRPLPHVTG
jgi:hypothetical protein